jgi:hypothetical protein
MLAEDLDFPTMPPALQAVITIGRPSGMGDEEIVLAQDDLAAAVADLETLHNAVEVFRAGGRGSDRGYQFLTVFGHCVKPAYVRAVRLRIVYPTV